MQSWLERARILSGLTVKECAQALFETEDAFRDKEANPGTLSLNELRVLMKLFNDDAKQLVWGALQDFRP